MSASFVNRIASLAAECEARGSQLVVRPDHLAIRFIGEDGASVDTLLDFLQVEAADDPAVFLRSHEFVRSRLGVGG